MSNVDSEVTSTYVWLKTRKWAYLPRGESRVRRNPSIEPKRKTNTLGMIEEEQLTK